MGCKCGSQIILCNLPVRFDTYRGCSHGCRYCFAQKKNDISHIERDESVDGLRVTRSSRSKSRFAPATNASSCWRRRNTRLW